MKKLYIYISLILLTLSLGTVKAEADSFAPEKDYTVSFNGSTLSCDYNRAEVSANFTGLEPGDDSTVTFKLKNDFNKEVYWWMSNDTLKTFEDAARKTSTLDNSITGGNYTYTLTYKPVSGATKEIYNSDKVGGDGSHGLQDATNALDEYFMLEKIGPGQESELVLHFELDGESQANNYQEVLGTLMVNFAVELPETIENEPGKIIKEIEEYDEKTGKRINRRVIYIPYTGDTINLSTFIVIELFLLAILAALIVSFIAYKRKQEAK